MARTLALTVGLVILIPPGWCCLVPAVISAPEAPSEVPSRCPCCPEQPCPEEWPHAPPSSPSPCPSCPGCCDREAMAISKADDYRVEIAPWMAVPAPAALLADRVDSAAPGDAPVPSRALHLLECVWLC